MTKRNFYGTFFAAALAGLVLTGCARKETPVESKAGPDNALTRYVDSRIDAVHKSESATDRANDLIQKQQQQAQDVSQ